MSSGSRRGGGGRRVQDRIDLCVGATERNNKRNKYATRYTQHLLYIIYSRSRWRKIPDRYEGPVHWAETRVAARPVAVGFVPEGGGGGGYRLVVTDWPIDERTPVGGDDSRFEFNGYRVMP